MPKKLSLKLGITYGSIFFIAIFILNFLVIFVYKDHQINKTEIMYKEIGNLFSDLISQDIKIENIVDYPKNNKKSGSYRRVIILNKKGIVTFDSEKELQNLKLTCPEIVEAIKNRKTSIGYYKVKNSQTAVLVNPVFKKGNIEKVVVLSTNIQDVIDDISGFGKKVSIVSLGTLLVVFIMSLLLGRRISKPIKELTKASINIQKGKLDVKVDIERTDEIGELAKTFNLMSSELYKIDAGRKRFVSDVSHELKTPLSSIKALIDPLIVGDYEISLYKEYLKDVDMEIDRLTALVKSLITATRLEEVKLNYEKIVLFNEVELVIKILSYMWQEKNITIINECNKSFAVNGDKSMVTEVLINLLDNAIKYSKDNGNIKIKCGEDMLFSIKDNGVGIENKHLPFIFDNFYRVDEARTRAMGGSGVGLFIVKRIVKLHNWKIDVRSEKDMGTEFIVSESEKYEN